jgi:hypothetical protein
LRENSDELSLRLQKHPLSAPSSQRRPGSGKLLPRL